MPDIAKIIAYENGELDEDEVIDLFQDGVDNGWAWNLQGSYGRMAQHLLDQGYISPKGDVNPSSDRPVPGSGIPQNGEGDEADDLDYAFEQERDL